MESIDLIKKLEEIDRNKGGLANEHDDAKATLIQVLRSLVDDREQFRKEGRAALRELKRRRAGKV